MYITKGLRRFSTQRPNAIFSLEPHFFTERESQIGAFGKNGEFKVSCFKYRSGVEALRIDSEHINVVFLPFQGQQVWHCFVNGEPLHMKSMFEEPVRVDTSDTWGYLKTYGAFYIHCGITAMGAPGEEDDHPLHGDLPNAKYDSAWLEFDIEDGTGVPTLSLCGGFTDRKIFSHNYTFVSKHSLRASSSLIDTTAEVTNNFVSDLDVMYMGHINFRPRINSEIIYSGPCDPNHVSVRTEIPAHVKASQEYIDFMQEASANPRMTNSFTPEFCDLLSTELVMNLSYFADESGWAHTLSKREDGRADYVAHKPSQLPNAVRWLVKEPTIEAMGMVLPSTSCPEGKTVSRQRGQVLKLPPDESMTFNLRYGLISDIQQVEGVEKHIDDIMAKQMKA